MSNGIITIRKGREKPIRNQHPWIFSGAVASADNAEDGDIVTVVDHKQNFLGRGFWNHKSQIQVRLMTWKDEAIDEAWWRTSLKRAIKQRYHTTEFHAGNRIVNAENDYMPGLIVDRYGEHVVLQALTLHIDQQKHFLAELIAELFAEHEMPIKSVYERSDVDVRGREGLREEKGLLWGEAPPELVQFRQEGLIRFVDVRNGHKTGYYLDQVDNHMIAAEVTHNNELFAPDARMLNTFAYTGGFGLLAAPHIVNVDASQDALKIAEHTYASNSRDMRDVEFIQGDVFEYLRDCVGANEQFDFVVLDPPKFAHNKQQVKNASRGYKDINLNAFRIIKKGGYLMTFSCSGAISRDLFQKIVFGALADSGRQAQVIRQLGASNDHPNALTFPEGDYLKGLLLRVY